VAFARRHPSGFPRKRGKGRSKSAPLLFLLLAAALATPALAGEIPLPERKSGYEFMGPQSRGMQDEDTANPGMLFVLEGSTAWTRKVGPEGKACADCHGDAKETMKGVAARYPKFDDATRRPIDLEGRIQRCRAEQQKAPPLQRESRELLALTVYVMHQSRGLPIEDMVEKDARLGPFRDAGRALFERRQGQIDMSCAQCHDDNWGKSLAGNAVPQGHPTGYPLYRLEWQSLGSLQRRLRNCLIGMRAETYAYGAPEYADLALYLMWRARGMKIETPAVRP
jgi:L-cysteine S-thiosulfotransferase